MKPTYRQQRRGWSPTLGRDRGMAGLAIMLLTAIPAIVRPVAAATLSQWGYDTATQQLEFTVAAGVTPRYFLLAEPARIVLDLPDTTLGEVPTQATYSGVVQSIRIAEFQPGQTRIVLQLAPDVVLASPQVELQALGGDRWALRPRLVGEALPATPISPSPTANPEVAMGSPSPDTLSATPPPALPNSTDQPGDLNFGIPLTAVTEADAADRPAIATLPPGSPPANLAPPEIAEVSTDSFPPGLPPGQAPSLSEPDLIVPHVNEAEDLTTAIAGLDIPVEAPAPAPTLSATAPTEPAASTAPAPAPPDPAVPETSTLALEPWATATAIAPTPLPTSPTAELGASPNLSTPPASSPTAATAADITAIAPSAQPSGGLPPAVGLPSASPAAATTPAPSASPHPTPGPGIITFGQPVPEPVAPALAAAIAPPSNLPALLLPADTVLALQYPGTQPLALASTAAWQEVLLLNQPLTTATGLVLPVGTPVIGQFETTAAGRRFRAQAIAVNGYPVRLQAESAILASDPTLVISPAQIIEVRVLTAVPLPAIGGNP